MEVKKLKTSSNPSLSNSTEKTKTSKKKRERLMFPFELEGTKMRPDIALKTLLRRIRKNMLEEFCETQDFRRKKRTKGPLYLE